MIKRIEDIRPKGLEGKLIRFVVIFVFCIGAAFLAVSYIQVSHLGDVVDEESEKQALLVQESVRGAMGALTVDSLYKMSIWAADKTDDEFWIFYHDLRGLSHQVENVIRNPENYEMADLQQPQKQNAGKYVLQILYPDGADNADPASEQMLGRLSNLSPLMEEIVRGNEGYTLDCCIAMPDGTTIVLDNLSDKKVDEEGNADTYDARKRPWFKGAVEAEGIYCSSAVPSAFYDFNEVVLGYPVYVDGVLAAVVELSTKLDVLEKKLSERNIGKDGFAILISRDGQLVCSSKKEGELMMNNNSEEDIRNLVNPELSKVITRALNGETGIEKVPVDSGNWYAAFAPVDTVGWTQLLFVSEEEIISPANKLAVRMDDATDKMLLGLGRHFQRSAVIVIIILLIIMLAATVFASELAKKRVLPIKKMSRAVSGFVEDDMEFAMQEEYRTGDEIEELARSFEIMSIKMKEYVKKIVENAAEKERLETEMTAARDIQMKMLPKRSPHFYNKPGYELFAKMVPAKNVGGDFYDFFYLDEDHLVLIIGDVSGKGITAALFMALCKQMIKSQLLLQNGDMVAAMTQSNLRLIEEAADGMFVTVWLAIVTLSTGEVNFIDAGHNHAMVKRGDGVFAYEDDAHSMLVGGLDFAEYYKNTIKLEKGDMLYLYTDGVTEAHNENNGMFGQQRLIDALNEARYLPVEELDTFVRNRVEEFCGKAEQFDDITTLVFKYEGASNMV